MYGVRGMRWTWSWVWVPGLVLAAVLAGAGPVPGRAPLAAAQQGPSLVLEPVIPLSEGAAATFLIGERLMQGLAERTGVFLEVPEEALADLEHDVARAVRVHYRVLAPDPASGAPRVRAQAVPVDPATGVPLQETVWEVTYILAGGTARREGGSPIPDEYAVLVEPRWLVDWSHTPPGQLPREPLAPGGTWEAVPDLELPGFPYGELQPDGPLTGEFVGWETVAPSGAEAARVQETLRGTSVARQDLSQEVPGYILLTVDVTSQSWFVPGDFPAQRISTTEGTIYWLVREEWGAPPGAEGNLAVVFVSQRVLVREADEAASSSPGF